MFQPWSSFLKTATILLAFAAGLAPLPLPWDPTNSYRQTASTRSTKSFSQSLKLNLTVSLSRTATESYVNLSLLENGKVHVATSSVQPYKSAEDPIFSSPMLIPTQEEHSIRDPKVSLAQGGKITAPELGVSVQKEDLGVELLDKEGSRIVRIRPTHSKEAWKTLEIDSDATDVYGLGEYPRAGGTDQPWLGSVARTEGDYGNIMSPFFGGVQTYTQFPVAYGRSEKWNRVRCFRRYSIQN